MTYSNDDLAWAAIELARFSHLPNYPLPGHPEAFDAYVKAFLRIVHRKHVAELSGLPEHPLIPGNPIDGDWLVERALDTYDHFPLPIELREIYQEYFTPRDGEDYFREGKKR